jgi:hypothetical protein
VLGTYEYTKTKGPEHQVGKMNLDLMNALSDDARELWRKGVVTAQGGITIEFADFKSNFLLD